METYGFLVMLAFVFLWTTILMRKANSEEAVSKAPVPAGLLSYEFSPVVLSVFKRENPARTDEQTRLAFQALKEFFILMWLERACGRKEPLGMPSVLADEAWHAFVLCTKPYHQFCKAYFGGMVHHEPNPNSSPTFMDENSKPGAEVARLWKAYARHQGRMQGNLTFNDQGTPLLFALDKAQRIEPGWIWTTAALTALAVMPVAAARHEAGSGGGGGEVTAMGTTGYDACGSSAVASCGDAGGGGGDGGAGSSCGSSCGSGCGGGGD